LRSPLRFLQLLSLQAFLLSGLWAENIRGQVVQITQQPQSVKLENLLVLDLSPGSEFQSGLELSITLPDGLLGYRHSFAIYAFQDISPEIDQKVMDYAGERVYFGILPSSREIFFQIPYPGSQNLTSSPNTFVSPVIDPAAEGKIIVSLLPVMKGLPDSVYLESFTVSVSPIEGETGELVLNLQNLDEDLQRELLVLINGVPEPYWENTLLLPAGLHQLSITGKGYKPHSQTFSVSQAEVTRLEVALSANPPRLKVSAPGLTRVLLNGIELSGAGPWVVDFGKHLLELYWEDYQIVREIFIEEGGTHEIEAKLEIFFHKPEANP
jgi:hypothetical protein